MEKLDENTERLLFNEFVSTEDYRPKLKYPFKQNGYIYASDATVLLRIRENIVTNDYIEQESPQVWKVIPETDCEIALSVKKIDRALKSANLDKHNDYTKPCPECGGSGEVTWEYCDKNGKYHTKEDECPYCDGECNLFVGYKELIGIGSIKFPAYGLFLLRLLAKYYESDTITIKHIGNSVGCLFNVCDGVDMLLMSRVSEQNVLAVIRL